MQKARSHIDKSMLLPLVGVWFQVLFHSSIRSAFHLSLTVLVHYRSLRSIQPYRMVPADSHRISRVPRYSGYYPNNINLRIRDFHSLWLFFPEYSTSFILYFSSPTTPQLPKQIRFGLLPFRSPLLWKSLLFSFPPGTQMFQFSGFASQLIRMILLHNIGLTHSDIFG